MTKDEPKRFSLEILQELLGRYSLFHCVTRLVYETASDIFATKIDM